MAPWAGVQGGAVTFELGLGQAKDLWRDGGCSAVEKW